MRLMNTPMSVDEFEDVLAAALNGVIVSDTGADEALDDALSAIASTKDPTPAQVAAARAAFAAQQV